MWVELLGVRFEVEMKGGGGEGGKITVPCLKLVKVLL